MHANSRSTPNGHRRPYKHGDQCLRLWKRAAIIGCFLLAFALPMLLELSPAHCQAPDRPAPREPIKGEWQFGVVAMMSSQVEKRGALVWEYPIGFVFPSISYSDWLAIGRGGGVMVFQNWEWLQVSTGAAVFGDEPIFSFSRQDRDFRNSRDTTVEGKFEVQATLPGSLRIQSSYHKDLLAHFGQFVEASVTAPPIPSFSLWQIGFGLGAGDENHNLYMYGLGARVGLAYHQFKTSLMLPFLPGGGMLILSYHESQISQSENRSASLVRPDDRARILAAICTWRL